MPVAAGDRSAAVVCTGFMLWFPIARFPCVGAAEDGLAGRSTDAISPQLLFTGMSASRSPRSIRTLTDCSGFLEAVRASTVMRVLICSKVSRASSRTSQEGTEAVRVIIDLVATAHSVPTGIPSRTMRYLHNVQNPDQQARMGLSQ